MMDIDHIDPNMEGRMESLDFYARAVVRLLWKRHDEAQEVVLRQFSMIYSSQIQKVPMPVGPSFRGLDMSGETCLVAGGAGGLGREVVKFLIQRGARMVVVGRKKSNDLRFPMVSGAEYFQVDISEPEPLRQIVEQVTPTNIFHLAGVLEDGKLKGLTWEHFESVLKPKVYGAQHLHDLSTEAKSFIMFSTMASILPFPRQMNHAAANAFLDLLAHERRSNRLPGLAINWGLWMEVGAAVSGNALDVGRKQGMRAMSNQEARLWCLARFSQKHLRCLGFCLFPKASSMLGFSFSCLTAWGSDLARTVVCGRRGCKGKERKGKEGKGRERKGKEGKGRQRKGQEGKGRERKGNEGKRKGKEGKRKEKGRERKGKEGKGRERKGKEGKGRERKGKEGKGWERKGKEGKGWERKGQEGEGRERMGKEGKGKGKEGKGRERKGKEGKGRERKGNEGKRKGKEGKRKGKGRERKGKEGKGRERKGKEGKGRERKGKEGKGMESKGKDGKGWERKGKEGKGWERKGQEGKGRDRKGKEGKGWKGRKREGKGRERKGKEGKGRERKGKEGKGWERKGKDGKGWERNGKGWERKGKEWSGRLRTAWVQGSGWKWLGRRSRW